MIKKKQLPLNHNLREVIWETRDTIRVGIGSKTAGITVRDKNLRTVQCQLTVRLIDSLLEQLLVARSHLIRSNPQTGPVVSTLVSITAVR